MGLLKIYFPMDSQRELSKHIREKRAVIWIHLKNLREIFLDFSAEPSEIGRELEKYFLRTIGGVLCVEICFKYFFLRTIGDKGKFHQLFSKNKFSSTSGLRIMGVFKIFFEDPPKPQNSDIFLDFPSPECEFVSNIFSRTFKATNLNFFNIFYLMTSKGRQRGYYKKYVFS